MSLDNHPLSLQLLDSAQPSTVGRFSLDNLLKYLPIDIHFIILAIWPALLMFIRGGWGFSPTGGIDAWIYLGYMLDLPNHERIFPGAYFGTRLPLLLPGYGLYRLFPPIVANYILHFGIYYIGIFSFYFILKNIFNRRTALLTALLLGVYGWYLVSTSWDYVDGIGMGYLLLTILLLLYAAKSKRWRLTIFAAGASTIALFSTNLFLLSFAPFLVAFYWFANQKYRKNNLFTSLVFYLLGGTAMVTLFGLAYKEMTGHFLYFMDSISLVKISLVHLSVFNMEGFWYSYATWLVFPTCTAIIAVFCLTIWRHKISSSSWLKFFCMSYLILFLYFMAWQFSGHSPILQLFYYASYLIPSVFMVVGALLDAPLSRLSNRQFLWVGCSAFVFLGLSHVLFPSSYPMREEFAGALKQTLVQVIPTLSIIIPAGIILGAVLIVSIKFKRPWLVSLAFLCFGLGNAMVSWNGQTSINGDDFSAVIKSAEVIKAITPGDDGYFWYDVHSKDGGIYTAIASTKIWSARLINDSFPSTANLSNTGRANFTIGEKIILLSTDAKVLDQAKSALKTIGLDARFVAQKQITEDNVSLFMVFATITKNTNVPASF